MKHVNTIKKLIDLGQNEEAHNALDNLLSLGPKNTEALKLRAMLFHAQGKFLDEAKMYEKVLDIDNEDYEAIEFFLKQRHEDHEHFYFTELLSTGGRRFHAYPKALLYTAFMGLLGCLAFLIIGKTLQNMPQPEQSQWLMMFFFLFVVTPFLGVVAVYFKSLKDVTLSMEGIQIRSRLKSYELKWQDIQSLYLVNNSMGRNQQIYLQINIKHPNHNIIELDLSDNNSALRAKSHFIRELSASPIPLEYKSFDEVNSSDSTSKRSIKF